MKCLENTRLQQLLTSSCIMYNLLWNEKSVQKVHTVPKTLLLLEVSWEYTIVGTKSSHCAQNFTFTWSVLRIHNFNNFWLLLALCTISFGMKSRYKKFTLCPKLYFPYHHLYIHSFLSCKLFNCQEMYSVPHIESHLCFMYIHSFLSCKLFNCQEMYSVPHIESHLCFMSTLHTSGRSNTAGWMHSFSWQMHSFSGLMHSFLLLDCFDL